MDQAITIVSAVQPELDLSTTHAQHALLEQHLMDSTPVLVAISPTVQDAHPTVLAHPVRVDSYWIKLQTHVLHVE